MTLVLSAVGSRFLPLNEAQEVPTGPAIGFIQLQREHIIARLGLHV
jgi:hypothetical protein